MADKKVKNEKIEKLIDDYHFSLEYPENLPAAFTEYGYWMAADPRTELHQIGMDEDERIKQLDIQLIKKLHRFKKMDIYPVYLEKDKNHPLEYWWWHLDKIAKKEYPAELLPEHLREIYITQF